MTAPPCTDQFRNASLDGFAAARNNWLDAFSNLEIAILRCTARLGLSFDSRKMPLAVRLSRLKELPASPQLSKAGVLELNAVAPACDRLLAIRAAIVHSRLKYGTVDEIPVALFQNSLDAAEGLPVHTVLTLEQFEEMRLELGQLARRFDAVSAKPPTHQRSAETSSP